MIEAYWAVIIGGAALLIGALVCYFVLGGKLSAAKSENSFIKTENQELKEQRDTLKHQNETLGEEISEKERAIAVKDTMLFSERTLRETAENEKKLFEDKYEALFKRMTELSAKEAATAESSANLKEWISKAENGLKDSFESLSKNITENNNRVFLETAGDKVGGIVLPMNEQLKELKTKVAELEEKRAFAYSGLTERVTSLQKQNAELKTATDLLNSTLKNNAQRGKWGEEQLRRVAELAGMVEHIDFEEQEVNTDKNRPDMVIHLTGGRTVPVDSKTPMNSYLLYLDDTTEEAREKHLKEHVAALKKHVDDLYKKAYWKSEDRSVEMVAMVVPYESGLSVAFTVDREIFSYAMEKNVLLLSPMTFYAFLKSVSIGWQENAMSQNAKKIAKQSRELVTRFDTFSKYFDSIGTAIGKAQTEYDKAMASYNRRLLPSFSRIQTLSKGEGELSLLEEEPEDEST